VGCVCVCGGGLTLLPWAGSSGRVVIADLLVGPINDALGAAEAGHILRLLAPEEAGDPGEAGDAEVLADVVEDTRVEAAEADFVTVRRNRRARSLHELGGEGLAEGAVVAVELNDPDGLPEGRSRVTCLYGAGRTNTVGVPTFWSGIMVLLNISGSSSMKTAGS
jgi:hypothetical protein